jgi:MFS family permease
MRAVWLLGPVLALALIPSNLVATALPVLAQEWTASATQMGLVYAAYQAGYVVAVLVLLPLTDRVAIGWVIGGGAAATASASGLFALLAGDVWSASALRAVAGAGLAGVYLPGVRVVAASVAPERRGLAVSVYVSAFYIGAAGSLWAAGALLEVTSWRGAAWALAAASAVGIPLAVFGTWRAQRPQGAAAVLRPRVLAHGPLLRAILGYAGHSWELYVARGWLAAFLAATLVSGGASTVDAAADGGKWAALMTGLGAAGVWFGGWLSDRLGRAPAAAGIATASGAIGLGFGWLAGAPWQVLLAVGCVYGVLMAADSGIYSAAVTEWSPRGQLGSAQASQAFIGFLASTISPVAAGWVLDQGGGFPGAFALGGLASLAGAVALLPLLARREGRTDVYVSK